MSYVDRHLLTGETVTYRTHLHWKIYGLPILLVVVVLAPLTWLAAARSSTPALALLPASVALIVLAIAWLRRRSSEFAVTTKRVIIKVGVLSTRSIELLLPRSGGSGRSWAGSPSCSGSAPGGRGSCSRATWRWRSSWPSGTAGSSRRRASSSSSCCSARRSPSPSWAREGCPSTTPWAAPAGSDAAGMSRRPFLTAEWRHLLLLNYQVEPRGLEPLVPHGTELDAWEGRTLMSLVGFRFLDTP